MLRLIIFFTLLTGAIACGLWVSEQPGSFELVWGGYAVKSTPGLFLVFMLAFAVAFSSFWMLLRWIFLLPSTMRRAFQLQGVAKGCQLLLDGFGALKSGDYRQAFLAARRAQSKLPTSALGVLLEAQTAAYCGDAPVQDSCYQRLEDTADATFLGAYYLGMTAWKRKDYDAALGFIDKARAINDDNPWVWGHLCLLYLRENRWAAATSALSKMKPQIPLEARKKRHYQAVTLYLQALASQTPAPLLAQAVAADPGFVPAVCAKAALLCQEGKNEAARKIYETAWELAPSLFLANACLTALPAEKPLDRFRQAQKLLALQPTSFAGHFWVTLSALQAHLWGEAKHHCDGAITKGIFATKGLLAAAFHEAIHHETAPQGQKWQNILGSLAQAAQWRCSGCHHNQQHWGLLCQSCGKIDSLKLETVIN